MKINLTPFKNMPIRVDTEAGQMTYSDHGILEDFDDVFVYLRKGHELLIIPFTAIRIIKID
jgi:hypothetical protein